MGSTQCGYRFRCEYVIIHMSQLLPVRAPPKIQTRFSGLISDSSPAADAGGSGTGSERLAHVLPASGLKNFLIPRATLRAMRFLNTGTLEPSHHRLLPL